MSANPAVEEGIVSDMDHGTLLRALLEELGPERVLTGEDLAHRLFNDWSEVQAAAPAALILPMSTDDVAAALRICNAHGAPVVVQGGLTGLAGGATARAGEVALSLGRMNKIELLDTAGGTAIVQAGVTLQTLQEAAAEVGLQFPLDLGARGSCQLGGNAATNAGGNRVLRFGMMRSLVLGLEAVLPDGAVLTMLDRVIKNNAGFDLKQLFIGTEGTLGVITRLSVGLVPVPAWQGTALCAVDDFVAALALLRHAKANLAGLTAYELMWRDFFDAASAVRGGQAPFSAPSPLYVLLESSAGSEAEGEAAFERALGAAMESGIVQDVVLARSQAQSAQLWAWRESVSELLSVCKPCAAFDVSVAVADMDDLVTELRTRLQTYYPSQHHLFFGHLGDGNLHLISGPFTKVGALEEAEEIVYECVGRFGGSISAEHGIGVIKQPFLHHSRDESELALMRGLKSLLDPRQILNPGRVLAPSLTK